MGTNTLRICSDLHTEFWVDNQCLKKTIRILESNEVLPLDERDKEATLIIAGDLGCARNFKQQARVLEVLSSRFKNIVLCGGNHEYYGGDWNATQKEYTNLYAAHSNLYTEYNNEIDGIPFFSGSLWTDFNKENPLAMELARSGMNDYNQITKGEKLLTPNDTLLEHKHTLTSLKEFLKANKDREKVVIVTHHAPSERSIPVQFKNSKLNTCYYTDLEYLIEKYQPSLWVHGHTHQKQDYMIGATRVVCNPLGYMFKEKTYYDPLKFLTV